MKNSLQMRCKSNLTKSLKRTVNVLMLLVFTSFAHGQDVQEKKPAISTPKNLVILISIDGFRNNYIDRGLTPNLLALAQNGAYARRFEPVFPSITFPNHYSQVTGLHPDHNGIVNNNMVDSTIAPPIFKLSDRAAIENPLWWAEGKPIWVTLHEQNKKSSTLFWVGSEAVNHGVLPDDWLKYDNNLTSSLRVQQLLQWLNRPDNNRADFATLYFSEVDSKGHEFGPDSPEVNAALMRVDAAIGELVLGLKNLNLMQVTTLVITSDHGMSKVEAEHVIDLSIVTKDVASAKVQWTGPLAGFDVNATDKTALLDKLAQLAHLNCWPKEAMPAQYHFGTHRRIPAVVCLAEIGWSTIAYANQKVIPGQHGYDPQEADMQGLFIAYGQQANNVQLDTVKNIDIYNLLTHLLKITGEQNDGEDTLYERIKK